MFNTTILSLCLVNFIKVVDLHVSGFTDATEAEQAMDNVEFLFSDELGTFSTVVSVVLPDSTSTSTIPPSGTEWLFEAAKYVIVFLVVVLIIGVIVFTCNKMGYTTTNCAIKELCGKHTDEMTNAVELVEERDQNEVIVATMI